MMKPFQDSDGTFHDHGRIMSQRAGHENDAHARRGNARTPSRWGVPPPGMSQHTPADVPPNAHTFMRKPRLPTNEFPARSTSSYIPDADEIQKIHSQRMGQLRAHYLASSKNTGEGGGSGASISPHFALQSALMELSDADVETEAMRLRTESIDTILTRTQEDAFAYTTTSNVSS